MNNILTLYDMEFKRIYKLFFICLGLLFIGNIGITFYSLYEGVRNISMVEEVNMSLDILRGSNGLIYMNDYVLSTLKTLTIFSLAIAVLMCLGYALVIWYRDFYSKNKTISTLLMLPQNRFNIYISKLITVVMMIFIVIVSQIIFWYIDLSIYKILLNIDVKEFNDVFSIIFNDRAIRHLIGTTPVVFFMIDFIGVILAVIVIFTGVLIERSNKKIGVFTGILYIGASIVGFFVIGARYGSYTDTILKTHLLYFIFLFIVSIGLSNRLLNKKVYL